MGKTFKYSTISQVIVAYINIYIYATYNAIYNIILYI